MTHAVVRRWLKVVDPTALTTRETLRSGLGFGPVVIDVARSDVLAFRWGAVADARGILERLALDTNLLQNPNKHQWELAVEAERLHPGGNIWVLVAREKDGAGLKETLDRRHLVRGPAPETARGILWELTLAGSDLERRRLAESMAVVRGRDQGLLSNPHVEDAVVLEAAPTARELAAILVLGPPVAAS
jgi:phosphoribosylformylglycinamidine (FGAM) synthase PurS component